MDINARIKELRESLGLTQEAFAKAFDSSKQNVSSWERGRTKPDGMAVLAMIQAFPVRPAWLLDGSGPMMAAPAAKSPSQGQFVAATLNVELISELLEAISLAVEMGELSQDFQAQAYVFAAAYSRAILGYPHDLASNPSRIA